MARKLTPEQIKQKEFEMDVKAARHCLEECPMRKRFEKYISKNKAIIQASINNPNLKEENKLNFLRGCLHQLDTLLEVPQTFINIDLQMRTQSKMQLAKTKKAETREKEIDA